MAATTVDERTLLDQGLERLAEILGEDFEITPYRLAGNDEDDLADAVYTVRANVAGVPYAQVIVEAKRSLTPAAAKEILLPQMRLLRQIHGQAAVLVIAPWLSPRTREILSERRVGYLDLTGNINFRLATGVFIRTDGAQHDPAPGVPKRRSRGLAGAAAGVVTRLLVDYCPPFRQKDLAVVGGVTPGYMSRVLRTLDDEALITRDGALIVDVNWPELLRARAGSAELMKINRVRPMVAGKSPEALYRTLISQGSEVSVAITGSYAAREVAPAAVGGTLMLYVSPDDVRSGGEIDDELGLVPPASNGRSNVILLEPPNNGPFKGIRPFGATWHVGLSQLVVDCLSGPGRLPAEGNAVLTHMIETAETGVWRRDPGELAREAAALS